MSKIRYAVLGAGWISQEAFMPGVDSTDNSVMTAIVTGNAEKAAKLAEFYNIPDVYSYDQFDDMLASGKVDAVYNALPNSMHAEFTVRALNAGIHVLVEKPMATTIEDCEAMIAAANASGAKLMIAYRLHCEPATVAAIERVASGEIGDPRLFTSTFSLQSGPGNHRQQAEHWGGPLPDIGVYCINAARHLFQDEPTEVVAMAATGDDARFSQIEENVSVLLRFPKGRMAALSVTFNGEPSDHYRVIGTSGELEVRPAYDFHAALSHVLYKDGTAQAKHFDQIDHFAAQTAYFSDCIMQDHPPEPDGAEGLADMVIMLAVEEAIKTGTRVAIDLPARPQHPNAAMVRMIPPTTRRLLV